MQIDALRYFLTVVHEKSISKAALKTHMSQSALSQMIQKLEEDLGHQLLHRSNRGVSLTPTGEIVLKYANTLIKSFDKMIVELNDYDSDHNKLIISGTLSLSAYSLPCMMYRIKKKFPEYNYELEAKNSHEIIQDLKDDMINFGFIDVPIEEIDDIDAFSYHKMGQEKVVLIAKEDYPVKDTIDLNELLNVELIMCTMHSKTCDHLEKALLSRSKTMHHLNIIFNSDSLTAVKSSVLNGYGMAFVPYESVKHELYEKSIKLIEVKDLSLDYDIYMLSKKPKDLSQSARLSREYLIEIGRKSFC